LQAQVLLAPIHVEYVGSHEILQYYIAVVVKLKYPVLQLHALLNKL